MDLIRKRLRRLGAPSRQRIAGRACPGVGEDKAPGYSAARLFHITIGSLKICLRPDWKPAYSRN
jgi:hypothetical protein